MYWQEFKSWPYMNAIAILQKGGQAYYPGTKNKVRIGKGFSTSILNSSGNLQIQSMKAITRYCGEERFHKYTIGGKEKIKRMALDDPDLEPLWEELRRL